MPSTEQEEYLYSYKTYPALRDIPPHCKHQTIRTDVTLPQFAAKSKEQLKIYGGEYKGQLGEAEHTILEQTEPPAEGLGLNGKSWFWIPLNRKSPATRTGWMRSQSCRWSCPGFFPGGFGV